MKISMTCPCGATFTIDANTLEAQVTSSFWRDAHKHHKAATPDPRVPTREEFDRVNRGKT